MGYIFGFCRVWGVLLALGWVFWVLGFFFVWFVFGFFFFF